MDEILKGTTGEMKVLEADSGEQALRDAAANAPEFAFKAEQPANVRGFRDPVIVFELRRVSP